VLLGGAAGSGGASSSAGLKRSFSEVDADSSGAVGREEFVAGMASVPPAAAERWLVLRRAGQVELVARDGGVVVVGAADVALMPTVRELVASVDVGVQHEVHAGTSSPHMSV
jgi:hypothetical protein